jgi:hypothetical protein
MTRLECQLEEVGEEIVLTVSVLPRFVASEEVTRFGNDEAKEFLLDKNIKHGIMVSSPRESLSNFNKGSLSCGKWIFTKIKESSEKQTTARRRPKPSRTKK